jgi:hypothetical protein
MLNGAVMGAHTSLVLRGSQQAAAAQTLRVLAIDAVEQAVAMLAWSTSDRATIEQWWDSLCVQHGSAGIKTMDDPPQLWHSLVQQRAITSANARFTAASTAWRSIGQNCSAGAIGNASASDREALEAHALEVADLLGSVRGGNASVLHSRDQPVNERAAEAFGLARWTMQAHGGAVIADDSNGLLVRAQLCQTVSVQGCSVRGVLSGFGGSTVRIAAPWPSALLQVSGSTFASVHSVSELVARKLRRRTQLGPDTLPSLAGSAAVRGDGSAILVTGISRLGTPMPLQAHAAALGMPQPSSLAASEGQAVGMFAGLPPTSTNGKRAALAPVPAAQV